jgi:hypothetical protein
MYPQNRNAAADEYAHSRVEHGGKPHTRHPPRESPEEAAHRWSSTHETQAGETLGRRDDDD